MHLLVLAKSPVPGTVKTRLCPPFDPVEAAGIAEAALADTLEAALGSGADRVVVALDGAAGPWLPVGVTVIAQSTGDLAARLTSAWTEVGGPGLQVGMDTPQVTSTDFDVALVTLAEPGTDAVLGPAVDGGWWAVGLRRPHPLAFVGIATGRPDTGARQRERLKRLGLRTTELATVRDVDTAADAVAVAAAAPNGHFARAVGLVLDGAVRRGAPATGRRGDISGQGAAAPLDVLRHGPVRGG